MCLSDLSGNPTIPITAHPVPDPSKPSLATALLLTHKNEELLGPDFDGTRIRYHHFSSPESPRPLSLCHILTSTTEKAHPSAPELQT